MIDLVKWYKFEYLYDFCFNFKQMDGDTYATFKCGRLVLLMFYSTAFSLSLCSEAGVFRKDEVVLFISAANKKTNYVTLLSYNSSRIFLSVVSRWKLEATIRRADRRDDAKGVAKQKKYSPLLLLLTNCIITSNTSPRAFLSITREE